MNIQIDQFIRDFRDLLDESVQTELNESTEFRNLKSWDSMSVMTLIGFYDEKFSIELNAEKLSSCITINDLYNLITSANG